MGLVHDRAALHTQLGHPITWVTLSARIDHVLRGVGWLPPHRDDERPEHGYHACAERIRRDWVGLGTTYSGFKRRGVHGMHLREGRAPPCRTVRRTRDPWSPSEPRHVPVVHAERGREERTARGYHPRI